MSGPGPAPARALAPGDEGRAVAALQHALEQIGCDPGVIDGVFGERTAAAVRALQRRCGLAETGEVTPALWARARELHAEARAAAHARAGEAAGAAAAFYEQIAADRRARVEAARARAGAPGRAAPIPAALAEEETAASLLAAARSWLDAAGHWDRAAGPRPWAAALQARARARAAASAAVPWFMSAADGHGEDLLQRSRALDGAAKAAAVAADAADMSDPPWPGEPGPESLS